jgi:hypothetical protein
VNEITYLTLSEHYEMRADIEKILVLWCITMHDSLTWPRNGSYQCRTCGRCYAVPWAAGDRVWSEN